MEIFVYNAVVIALLFLIFLIFLIRWLSVRRSPIYTVRASIALRMLIIITVLIGIAFGALLFLFP